MTTPTLKDARKAALQIQDSAPWDHSPNALDLTTRWHVVFDYLESLPAAQVEQEIIVAAMQEQIAAADVLRATDNLEIMKLRHALADRSLHRLRVNDFPQRAAFAVDPWQSIRGGGGGGGDGAMLRAHLGVGGGGASSGAAVIGGTGGGTISCSVCNVPYGPGAKAWEDHQKTHTPPCDCEQRGAMFKCGPTCGAQRSKYIESSEA